MMDEIDEQIKQLERELIAAMRKVTELEEKIADIAEIIAAMRKVTELEEKIADICGLPAGGTADQTSKSGSNPDPPISRMSPPSSGEPTS